MIIFLVLFVITSPFIYIFGLFYISYYIKALFYKIYDENEYDDFMSSDSEGMEIMKAFILGIDYEYDYDDRGCCLEFSYCSFLFLWNLLIIIIQPALIIITLYIIIFD